MLFVLQYNGKSALDVRQGGTSTLLWPKLAPGWTQTRGGRDGVEIAINFTAIAEHYIYQQAIL